MHCDACSPFPSATHRIPNSQVLAAPNAFIYREVIEHIPPKFARPALVASRPPTDLSLTSYFFGEVYGNGG